MVLISCTLKISFVHSDEKWKRKKSGKFKYHESWVVDIIRRTKSCISESHCWHKKCTKSEKNSFRDFSSFVKFLNGGEAQKRKKNCREWTDFENWHNFEGNEDGFLSKFVKGNFSQLRLSFWIGFYWLFSLLLMNLTFIDSSRQGWYLIFINKTKVSFTYYVHILGRRGVWDFVTIRGVSRNFLRGIQIFFVCSEKF